MKDLDWFVRTGYCISPGTRMLLTLAPYCGCLNEAALAREMAGWGEFRHVALYGLFVGGLA